MTARLMGDLSQPLQQRVGAARHEAWRDRRMHQRPPARLHLGQPLDEAPGVGDRRICIGIAIKIRALRGIVHRHLADQRALAAVQADFGQHQIGLDMDGAEIDAPSSCRWRADCRPASRRPPAQIRCRRISPRAETCISAAIPRAARRAPCRAAPIAARGCAGRPCPAAGTGPRRARSASRRRALRRGSRRGLRGRCARLSAMRPSLPTRIRQFSRISSRPRSGAWKALPAIVKPSSFIPPPISKCLPIWLAHAARAGPAGKMPDMTMKPGTRLTRSPQRRIAG